MKQQRGDKLLEKVLAGASDDVTYELLNEFHAGYPLSNLLRLLESNTNHAVKAGAWIASELGTHAAPLLQNMVNHLNHPLRYVRFFLLGAILLWAGARDGHALASAICLLRDPEDAVRWKALCTVTNMSREQLAASIPAQSDRELAEKTSWLVSVENDLHKRPDIVQMLNANDSLDRIFAVSAAARMATKDSSILKIAAVSKDVEVNSFAIEQLKLIGH